MKQPKISVVIPIYNVEQYLGQCIDSVLSQTYQNLEIILVDDGSTDQSGSIVKEYSKKDSRIIACHQKNQGLSGARNTGIDIATGEYLFFLDSDDYLKAEALSTLYDILTKQNADMSVLSADIVDEYGVYMSCEKINPSNDERGVVTPREYLSLIQKTDVIGIVAWSKLYKAELFQEIRFEEGKIHEDEGIISKILYQCQKIAYANEALLCYRQRRDSIMGKSFRLANLDKCEFLAEQMWYFIEQGYDEYLVDWFGSGSGMLIYGKNILGYKQNQDVRDRVDGLYKDYKALIRVISKRVPSKKNTMKRILFCMNLKLYDLAITFMKKWVTVQW